jgi:ATP-dependent 26S proteasome regulatory subunit
VPQFLAEMDGFDTTDALFLIATNRPDIIDPAFHARGTDRHPDQSRLRG